MKKFIFMMVAFLATVCATAQNYATSNYVGSSKFTDNWSITLQGGVLTTVDNFFDGNTAMAPIVVLGADKYVNKWLGFGIEGRTMIGTGTVNESRFNSKTAFETLNLSGYVKINLLNIFSYNGERKVFEPVLYTGLGWHHSFSDGLPNVTETSSQMVSDAMTGRVGCEFTFNLGRTKAFGVMLNPSFVWNNINNMRLVKSNCDFEITGGVVYHFKTSNGTHGFAKAKLYNQAEIDRLNAKINELEARPAQVVEKIVKVPETNTKTSDLTSGTYHVAFAQNSSELSETAKAILNKIPAGSKVSVAGSTSPEGTTARNTVLAQERADAVANYLKSKGVDVVSSVGGEAGRAAIVTLEK